jgi:hypothetical protein
MDADEVWAVWRRLTRALPMWQMPLDFFLSPSMWTLFGLDLVSGLRRNASTRRIFAELAPLSPADLRRVNAIAQMNHRRHEAISRWMAVAFLTLPASAALVLSELSPRTLAEVAGERGPGAWYLLLTYAGGVVALYLLAAWRARQLTTVVEMVFIERGLSLASEAGDGGPPLEAPLGA